MIIFEIGARLLTPFPFTGDMANTVPHDKLGYTASPKLPGIDRHGFRNPENQDESSIVVLGDSHTYGFNVASDNSWPYALARKTGRTVYNYGMGGYGILQYVFLFNEAIKKRPQHIILGFYVTNDLQDYCAVATLPYWRKILGEAHLRSDICIFKRKDNTKDETNESKWVGAIKAILKKTAVGSAFDYYVWDELVTVLNGSEDSGTRGEQLVGIETGNGNHKTYISYRRLIRHLHAMDPEDVGIKEAIKASEHFFLQMGEKAREQNITFSVLFIPSKERVFFEWAKKNNVRMNGNYVVTYETVVRREEALVRRFQDFFSRHNVQTVDAIAYVTEALKDGSPLYPASDEGHPLESGYNAYADAAVELVRKKAAVAN